MAKTVLRKSLTKLAAITSISALLVLVLFAPWASALELSQLSLQLSDGGPSVAANYDVKFKLPNTTDQLGSIEFQFCSNSSLFVDPCAAPIGFDANGASISSQSGATGFVIGSASANEVIISRPPAVPGSDRLEYDFSNVQNPGDNGSYYLRIQTFASEDASGSWSSRGALGFAISSPANIKAEVPPYITFCVGTTIVGYDCNRASGSYINFGELSPGHPATGTEQFLVATNALNGYNISVLGHTMISGNNVITSMSQNAPSVSGSSQFGINLVANTNPQVGQNPSGPGIGTVVSNYSQPDSFRFDSGEVLVTSSNPSASKKFTVSYIVNRPPHQAPGIYATTMTFVALGNF